MGTDDHLDNEIEVSAQLTQSGVTAKAKSRTVSAIDRLGGNLVDFLNTKIEKRTSRDRAIIRGEKQLMDAVVKSAVERIEVDPAFADRAVRAHFHDVLENQENKDGVVSAALEDLRTNPPTGAEATTGPDELSPEFQSRFGEYAKVASTDELRSRWGRVLASEIRKPGTFSPKVLRVIDELTPQTARHFERFCGFRIGKSVPIILFGEINFGTALSLTSSELIIDPGQGGHVLNPSTITVDGTVARLYRFEMLAISVPADASRQANKPKKYFDSDHRMRVYLLSPSGQAIASILPDRSEERLREMQEKLRAYYGQDTSIQTWRPNPNDREEWISYD